jgi:DNA invertase Pin-like site-specific DNA recombinase
MSHLTDEPTSQLIELQFAAERRLRAEETRKAAAAELRERIVDAYEAGIPVSRIAREARVSRQAVYEMLGLRRLSRPRG